MNLLAGDIGGTKADLAIYSTEEGLDHPLAATTVRSADYPDLETAASAFVETTGIPISEAVFGVAGPVVQGRVVGTNLPWTLDEATLVEALGVRRATLLNDLLAIANAVPHLPPKHLHSLNQGTPHPGGALAVVAPGTGMGQGFMTWDGERYHPHPSEGGHATFSPNSDLEVELLIYLRQRYRHVSVERVCSGRWMISLYEFLRDEGHAPEPEWLAERLTSVDDPTPVIVANALDTDNACDLCLRTVELFVQILASAAGNLGLTVMATGGVYLAGGMPLRLLPYLTQPSFREAFVAKGRLSYLVQQMPVQVVMHPQAGLYGAAAFGLDRFQAGD